MNNLQPEERRAKADEIARLLENEPLMVQDLLPLLKSTTIALFSEEAQAPECDSCLNPAEYCGDCMRAAENRWENMAEDLNGKEEENAALAAEVRELKDNLSDALLELEKQKELYRITVAP